MSRNNAQGEEYLTDAMTAIMCVSREASHRFKSSFLATQDGGEVMSYNNPEELLVASLSTCHMLWVLHLCADAGIVITSYTDNAAGEMAENANGSGHDKGMKVERIYL